MDNQQFLENLHQLPTTSTSNCPASAVDRKRRCVLGSSAIVFALGKVLTFSTTEYLPGLSWRITVIVPSPLELKTSREAGSKAVASTWSPIGSVAITCPVSAFMTAITLLRHPINRRRFCRSIAILDGDAQGAVGQRCSTFSELELIFSTRLASSILL